MLMAAVMPPDAALLHNSQMVPMLFAAYNEMLVGYIPGDAKLAYERNRDNLMRYWVPNAVKVANSEPGGTIAGCVALAVREVIGPSPKSRGC